MTNAERFNAEITAAEAVAMGADTTPAVATAEATAAPTAAANDAATAAEPGRAPGPWSVRTAQHRRGRAALEVYEHGELLDVVVASALSSEILRGARRSVRGGRPAVFAWGRLTPDGELPSVSFTGGWLRRADRPARVVPLAGEFWLAWAEGPCGRVVVRRGDGSSVRRRAGRAA